MQAQEQAQAEMAAALEAEELQVQEQEWNMAELERIQEQQVCLAHSLLHLSAMLGALCGLPAVLQFTCLE